MAAKNKTIENTKQSKKRNTAKKTSVKSVAAKTGKRTVAAKKKTAIGKSTAGKSSPKGKADNLKKGKSTSELLKAIKARDMETHKQEETAVRKTRKPKAATKGKAAKKPVARPKPLLIVTPMQKPVEIVASSRKRKSTKRRAKFSKASLEKFKKELLFMREHFTGQTDAMKHDALRRDDEVNPEEDGTDAFLRLQALNQMNDQQHVVIDIDKAIAAIDEGTYGVCEMCGSLISKRRLKARPFAKFCVSCKEKMERGPYHKKKH
ncbi:MAG: TraR/DksA C4-type zinc finger protein [Kiritimatiellia bacterium]